MSLQPSPGPDGVAAPIHGYARAVRAAYARAERVAGQVHERAFRIADGTIRVRGPGEALVDLLTEALAHLAVPADAVPATAPQAAASLTIHLWDSGGEARAAPPWPLAWYRRQHPDGDGPAAPRAQFDGRGELPGFNTPGVRAAFGVGPNVLHLLDLDRGESFCWFERAQDVPYHETASPFLRILSWWADARGWLFAHAGAVGTAAGGLLLVGPGGSGKSTTALACLGSALGYAGDDHCLVSGGPGPRVASVYSSAKLKGPADLERFPHLASLVRNPGRLGPEKALLFLHRHCPGQLAAGFPLRAVVVPRVTGRSPRLGPLAPTAALAAMAPSTCRQLPGHERRALGLMAGLVRQLPCYALETGPTVRAIPEVLQALLSGGG